MATAKGSPRALDSNSKINVKIHTPDTLWASVWYSQYLKEAKMSPLLTESVNPLLPVKDLFVEARRYAKSNFPYGRCDIVYRGMYVEQDATPFGLDMENYDWVAIVPTFEKGVNTYGMSLKECLLPFVKDPFKEGSFHIGPVRNGGNALPIRRLLPNNRESMECTVDTLVESWVLEVRKEGFEVKDKPTFLLYKDKKLALGKNIKIKDVIDTRMQNHYFCFPLSTQDCSKEVTSIRPSLDMENIDELVKCIDLSDEDANSAATGTKRRKKRQGQRQRLESELAMRQVPEARQNSRVRHDPEANKVAVSKTPSNFNEHLVAGASQRETINMKKKKKKKERACAKDQNKEEAESLFIDQVTSHPHLRLLYYKFLVMTMRLIPCCHYHYNAGGASSSIRQEGGQGN